MPTSPPSTKVKSSASRKNARFPKGPIASKSAQKAEGSKQPLPPKSLLVSKYQTRVVNLRNNIALCSFYVKQNDFKSAVGVAVDIKLYVGTLERISQLGVINGNTSALKLDIDDLYDLIDAIISSLKKRGPGWLAACLENLNVFYQRFAKIDAELRILAPAIYDPPHHQPGSPSPLNNEPLHEVGLVPSPFAPYNQSVASANNPQNLYDILMALPGLNVGSPLTQENLRLISQTAFNAIITDLVHAPENILDPMTGLELPPKPRETDFQCRGKGPSGKRMTFAEYLRDEVIGWGTYTKHHMLSSFWINELDPNLYAAMNYQAKKEAAEANVIAPTQRLEFQDAFFLRHGILTPGHLINPPAAYKWQAKVLAFIKKLQTPLPMGRRTDAGERS